MIRQDTDWYAIQILSGQDHITQEYCRSVLSKDLLPEVFCPELKYHKKYHGAWHEERKLLFPGYLFVVTKQIDGLKDALHQIPKLTKVLGTDNTTVALSEKEVAFLKHFLNSDYEVDISEGILVGDQLIIQSGPLKGMEGIVKRIDRHKRIAVIETDMFHRKLEMTVGLEVVEKREVAEK